MRNKLALRQLLAHYLDHGFHHSPTTLYAQEKDGTWYYFSTHPDITRLYDSKLPVHQIEVTELIDEPDEDSYFAWWDAEDKAFCHVYRVRGLVEMCFPYGAKAEEERGHGKLLPVRLTDCGPAVEPAT